MRYVQLKRFAKGMSDQLFAERQMHGSIELISRTKPTLNLPHLAVLAGAMVSFLGASQSADAQGVRLTGTATQTFQLDNNFNFSGENLGIRSYSRVSASLVSETETTRIAATSGTTVGFVLSNGGSLSVSRPSLRLSFRNERSRFSAVSGSLSYNKSPISFEQVQSDFSLIDQDADRTTIRGSLGYNGRVNRLTRGRITFTVADVDFDPRSAELVPYVDYNLSGDLTYNRSETTSYTLTAALGSFDGDGVAQSKSLSGRLSAGMTRELDNRTSVNGQLGLAYINTEEIVGGNLEDEWNLSLLFGAGIDYALADGSLSFGISQSLGPSATGQLALFTGLNADYSKQLTEAETVGLSASLNRQETISVSSTSAETFLSLSPTYTRQLNSDVELQAAVSLTRDDSGSFASGISFTFERPFSYPLR